jgi:CDP-glycerol glycerophosphotransferase (TagB/SpsB family)
VKNIAERKNLIIATIVAIMIAVVSVFAEVPNVFSPGTVAKSSQVNENFNYLADRLLTRTVIEGTFDTTKDGDVVKNGGGYSFHWKMVDVPQIALTNMPMIWVYIKASTNQYDLPVTNNWFPLYTTLANNSSAVIRYTPSFIVDEGKVYIYYKRSGDVFTTGDYKIIIIK